MEESAGSARPTHLKVCGGQPPAAVRVRCAERTLHGGHGGPPHQLLCSRSQAPAWERNFTPSCAWATCRHKSRIFFTGRITLQGGAMHPRGFPIGGLGTSIKRGFPGGGGQWGPSSALFGFLGSALKSSRRGGSRTAPTKTFHIFECAKGSRAAALNIRQEGKAG